MKRIIPFLALLLLLTGCAGKADRSERCSHYTGIYEAYLTTTTLRPISPEESIGATAAAVFLKTYCGWTGPRAGPGERDVDSNGVPIVFPPPEPAPKKTKPARVGKEATRSGVALRSGPIAIGPPAAGRLLSVPLAWDHNPAVDGTTQYRLYWSRTLNQWDGLTTLPATNGQTYIWQTPTAGLARFVITAARPPRTENGESEWQESDPSNILQLQLAGPPVPPGRLRKP